MRLYTRSLLAFMLCAGAISQGCSGAAGPCTDDETTFYVDGEIVGCERAQQKPPAEVEFRPLVIRHSDGSVAAQGLAAASEMSSPYTLRLPCDPEAEAACDSTFLAEWYDSLSATSRSLTPAEEDSLDALPVRSGEWTYSYPSGQTQASLSFEYAEGPYCCIVPCQKPYDVKVDSFAFYHPNGQLLAEGAFVEGTGRYFNNCEGGALLREGRVRLGTPFFDSTGARISNPERVEALRERIERW